MPTQQELLQELDQVNSSLYNLTYALYQAESEELTMINKQLSVVQDKNTRKKLLGDFLDYRVLMASDVDLMNRIVKMEFGL